MTNTHESLMALCDAYAYAALNVKDTAGRSMTARAALSDALKQVCDDLDAFDKAENSFMRKAIELEAEVEKLKADNLDLRSDEALNDAEAEIEKLKNDLIYLREDRERHAQASEKKSAALMELVNQLLQRGVPVDPEHPCRIAFDNACAACSLEEFDEGKQP